MCRDAGNLIVALEDAPMLPDAFRSVVHWPPTADGPLARRDFAHFLELAAAVTVVGLALTFWRDIAGLAGWS